MSEDPKYKRDREVAGLLLILCAAALSLIGYLKQNSDSVRGMMFGVVASIVTGAFILLHRKE